MLQSFDRYGIELFAGLPGFSVPSLLLHPIELFNVGEDPRRFHSGRNALFKSALLTILSSSDVDRTGSRRCAGVRVRLGHRPPEERPTREARYSAVVTMVRGTIPAHVAVEVGGINSFSLAGTARLLSLLQ